MKDCWILLDFYITVINDDDLCLQVFDELEEMGKTIQEDVLDAGMPVHGAMGGDISKCPYYAAKMGMLLYSSVSTVPL